MHDWLTGLLRRLSGRSTLAQAIRYALNHWKGPVRFLDDGRFELDTKIVERAICFVALGRKNAFFCRGGQRRKTLGDGRHADPDSTMPRAA
jgi:transposase